MSTPYASLTPQQQAEYQDSDATVAAWTNPLAAAAAAAASTPASTSTAIATTSSRSSSSV